MGVHRCEGNYRGAERKETAKKGCGLAEVLKERDSRKGRVLAELKEKDRFEECGGITEELNVRRQ